MSAVCVEKLPHSCGADRALQVFEENGEYTGYCFSCKTYVPNPYEDKPASYKPKRVRKSVEEIEQELNEISEYGVVDLPERKLRKASLDYFGIKIGVSETDGSTPIMHFYPYYKDGTLLAYKTRLIENKRMWSVGDQSDVDLFGWDQAVTAGGKKLMITEGELDAVALFQICKDHNAGTKYAEYNPSVVSLPHGAASAAKSLSRLLPKINRHFKEIVLVFDMDDPGKKAVEEVLKIIPDAKVASLPEKDVNDCLIKGKSRAAYQAIQFNAEKPKNTRIVRASDVIEAARKEVPWGFSYPYKKLTQLTRGRRFGETYYFGAGVKMGKSELLNDLVAWDIKEHKFKVFVVKPEESNIRTLQGVVGKLVNGIFHDPAIPFDYDLFDKGVAMLSDNLVMLNLYQELSWEGLKADIRAAVAEGVKSVYIDPITVLSNGIAAAEANTLLQKMAQELAQMAMDLQILVHLFCHLKAPDTGPSHERGGSVQSHQFAGSRAMMRSCNSMIGIEGNKDPDLPEDERNIRTLVLLEDRMSGASGKIPLWWNNKNGSFNEI